MIVTHLRVVRVIRHILVHAGNMAGLLRKLPRDIPAPASDVEREAARILKEFVRAGRLSRKSRLLFGSDCQEPGVVEIHYLEVPADRRRRGHAEAFLRALKAAGIEYDILVILDDARPFWRRMRDKELLSHSVSEYPSFESGFGVPDPKAFAY